MIWLLGSAIALGSLLTWPRIQHWLAEFAAQIGKRWSSLGYILQSALVRIDRVMVTGQRLFSATIEFVVRNPQSHEQWTVSETERLNREDIPEVILNRLEQTPVLEFTLTVSQAPVVIPLHIHEDD